MKALRKVTELGQNEGILCRSEEEAKGILKLLHENSLCQNIKQHYFDDIKDIMISPYHQDWSVMDIRTGFTRYPASDFLQPTYEVTREQLKNVYDKYNTIDTIDISEFVKDLTSKTIKIFDSQVTLSNDYVNMLFEEYKNNEKLQALKEIFPTYEKPKQIVTVDVFVNVYESGNIKGIYQTRESAEYNDASKQTKTIPAKLTYEI